MTVHELIQELSRYPAESEVDFRFERNFSVDVEFDDSVDFDGIRDDYYKYDNPVVVLK